MKVVAENFREMYCKGDPSRTAAFAGPDPPSASALSAMANAVFDRIGQAIKRKRLRKDVAVKTTYEQLKMMRKVQGTVQHAAAIPSVTGTRAS